ncbi:glutaredoxin domain containing protein [Grosmannia clavigera kw1407]|uniref:Glutaredoxin-like protein n=1 Tax=Grosmannia clavigera (strain kw1407 / UAMH 11150) TaxID=655863 RepID=F0XDB7_GROCL|nr:glutaredoxin domain containing protein [Grosmannia clavigera kw1407]EFX04024.1 glutaredoxin domain containing protein [Grosmannia clavigera kw1407]
MRPSMRLLQQQSCRITLFTRAHCGLCVQAKSVLSDVWDVRPFEFREVDVVQPEAKGWRDLYDLDVPVIHINKASAPEEDPKRASKAVKLMHRFSPADVQAKMDLADKA